jgi:hypothetical protein
MIRRSWRSSTPESCCCNGLGSGAWTARWGIARLAAPRSPERWSPPTTSRTAPSRMPPSFSRQTSSSARNVSSWAQTGELACTVKTPRRRRPGRAWAAIRSPTACRHVSESTAIPPAAAAATCVSASRVLREVGSAVAGRDAGRERLRDPAVRVSWGRRGSGGGEDARRVATSTLHAQGAER